MSASTHGTTPYYYVPAESRHPVMALRPVLRDPGRRPVDQRTRMGQVLAGSGLVWWLFVLYQWFRDAARESEGGLYGRKIDLSYRWSMSWFIFSEVMFFGAFFTALWWARALCARIGQPRKLSALARLQGRMAQRGCRCDGLACRHRGAVPDRGPLLAAHDQHRTAADVGRDADDCPPRIAREPTRQDHRLHVGYGIAGHRVPVRAGLRVLPPLHDLNLKLSSGVFGSTFFMLTGFHGFHVFIGMLMLLFITLRLQKGHFTADKHFGFEGAAWYWHFVDVVTYYCST
jgi:cytochrome c oxidase subunit 3